MPILADSQHVTINGGHFVDQSIINGQTGIDMLLEASNPDAAHDTSARDYAPRCHSGTREQYIQDIVSWGAPAVGATDSLPLLWMKGLAGVGKSAIAQTCAEELERLGRLGATFFFAVNIRDDAEQFFPTIAYQLSTQFPDYRDLLDHRIRRDRTILKKKMAIQFQALIVEPFQELENIGRGIGRRMVIIVDGLDECKRADDQCRIIEVIVAAARKGTTPFCWAFFSRPESHIEVTFKPEDVAQVTCMVPLSVDGANSDIELYLRSGFEKILRRHNIPATSQWPSDKDIQTLVKASGGLFVYAAAVLRDVDQAGSPDEALGAVCATTPDPTDSSLFTGLDAFYMLIMQRIPPEKLPSVLLLCRLLCGGDSYPGSRRSSGVMRWSNILGLSEIGFRAVCNQLSAVLHIYDHGDSFDFSQFGNTDRPFQYAAPAFIRESEAHISGRLGGSIHFYHKSFYDFLITPTRSGTFCVWSDSTTNAYFKHCLGVILKYEESYCFRGSELILAPGVADSASSLSWPYTNELVNSILKARVYSWAFDTCFQFCGLPEIERQLPQHFGSVDFRKPHEIKAMPHAESGPMEYSRWGCNGYHRIFRRGQLFRTPRGEFQEHFDVINFKAMVKRWKECGIIQPYHPNFGSRFKPLVTKKSKDKHISGLYRLGHGPKSVFWYWEINLREEYYQEFTATDLAEGERIYREERFELWPTELWRP